MSISKSVQSRDIIQATNSHLSAVADLIGILQDETDLPDRGIHFDLDSTSLAQAAYLMQRQEAAQGFVLLAIHEKRAVGMLLSAQKSLPLGKSALDLTIVVEKTARRQGFGEALMRVAERLAPSYRIDVLTLSVLKDNTSAIQLYKKMGFDEIVAATGGERHRSPQYSVDQYSIKMMKRVTSPHTEPNGKRGRERCFQREQPYS